MDNIWLIGLTVAALISFLLLIGLAVGHIRLKRQYKLLLEAVTRNSNDITGLCAAAVTVDEQMSITAEQLTEIWEKLTELKAVPAAVEVPHAYSNDIQKVRSGASIHELMQSSGLSHDEAALLIRLHGNKSQLS